MRQFTTLGIILTRTDFGEADRILTFITPQHGKVRAIAKGVRKTQAKLAGAIELFSVSELTLIVGRGEINTLISARLARHYDKIAKDINRVNIAYESMRILDKSTQDKAEATYFTLLDQTLAALNDTGIPCELTSLWFRMQLLKLSGHTPNLKTDESGRKLEESNYYIFDFEKTRFVPSKNGEFDAAAIKFLRLGFVAKSPKILAQINRAEDFIPLTKTFTRTLLQSFVRV